MFVTLLVVTFAVALATSGMVVRAFRVAIAKILDRIVSTDLRAAWHRYLDFAVIVVGVSGGVRIWDLERYITPRGSKAEFIGLSTDRWILELYRTLIGTLESTAWLLLVFFAVALIAYVIARGFELLRPGPPAP